MKFLINLAPGNFRYLTPDVTLQVKIRVTAENHQRELSADWTVNYHLYNLPLRDCCLNV